MAKNEDNWLTNYEALKSHVMETGHFFNKHNKLCNWAKYQRKRIKAGTMPEEQRVMFEELEKMRCGEHTGGCKKKATPHSPCLGGGLERNEIRFSKKAAKLLLFC